MLRSKAASPLITRQKVPKNQFPSPRKGERSRGVCGADAVSPSRVFERHDSLTATCRRVFDNDLMDGLHNVDEVYRGRYQRGRMKVMTGCISGMAFVSVVAVFLSLYTLCRSYVTSVSCGIIFSVVFHPNCYGRGSHICRAQCVERMRSTCEGWSRMCSVFGAIASLTHFFRYAVGQMVAFSGVDKLLGSFGKRERKCVKICQPNSKVVEGQDSQPQRSLSTCLPTGAASSWKRHEESTLACVVLVILICLVAHLMFGIVPFLIVHVLLCALFVVTVPVVSSERFVMVMWRVWLVVLALFFSIGFLYNITLDVISVSNAVKQTTSVVIGTGGKLAGVGTGDNRTVLDSNSSNVTAPPSFAALVELARFKVNNFILQELAYATNQTNVTELALTVQQIVGPVVSSLSSDVSVGSLLRNGGNIRGHVARIKKLSAGVAWTDAAQRLMERWQEFFTYANHVLLSLGSNVLRLFDSLFAMTLLFVILRYLLQLEHTILYYGLAKVLKVLDPHYGELHAHKIETELTTSFLTLLQSFWQKALFRFCITFCLFKWWSFPTPLLFGVVSSVTAVVPLVPRWVSPVALSFMYKLSSVAYSVEYSVALADPCLWCCFFALCTSFMDERLLCVSQGFVDDQASGAPISALSNLPTGLVSAALVLGFIQYGVCGIFIGPMTIVLARVLYDNWDTAVEQKTFC